MTPQITRRDLSHQLALAAPNMKAVYAAGRTDKVVLDRR